MSLMRYAGAVVSPFNWTIMHPEGALGVTGEGKAMLQCHPVTYRSTEAKSQVSPCGVSTDPTLHLGAIMGLSYLNSVQLSLSIFILLLIRLVITIPQKALADTNTNVAHAV